MALKHGKKTLTLAGIGSVGVIGLTVLAGTGPASASASAGPAFRVTSATSAGVNAPAALPRQEKCSARACEYVDNGPAGSNVIFSVRVWDPTQNRTVRTERVLVNGVVQASTTTNAYPGPTFRVFNGDPSQSGFRYPAGTCIQGGIVGLANARTPCWIVP